MSDDEQANPQPSAQDNATAASPAPPHEGEGQWFAVHVLSNKEGSAKRYLERYLAAEEMEDYLFEVLMPTEVVTEVKSGKKRQITRKLYPGYLFLRMRLYDENDQVLQKPWYYVNGSDGVIGFLGGKRPHALKDHEVQEILARVAEAEGKEVPKVQFDVGEEVKINDGPFVNLSGRVEEVDPEHGRLKVSVSIFGRFTPVVLEYWQVERVTE